MSVDSLTGKKLKIWSKMNGSQVLVVQDGSAADSDATIKVDDGFLNGYAAYGSSTRVDRTTFTLDQLECGKDGKRLRFRISDYIAGNALSLGFGDRVELTLAQGGSLNPGGSFDSWHAHEQGEGQAVQFFGFIRETTRHRETGGISEFQIEAVDPVVWANEVTVVHDIANGLSIPTIIMGDVKTKDADWFLALKKLDATPSYGWGNPRVPGLTMTVGEILDYLQNVYASALTDLGLYPSSGDLFDADELALLTDVPPKMVFDGQGFGSVVRAIMRNAYPDWDVRVDPRTKRWHFVNSAKYNVATGFGTIVTWISSTQFTVNFADLPLFAESGTGSYVRMVNDANLYETEIAQIVDITGATITVSSALTHTYSAGDLVVPMFDAGDRPPTVNIDINEWSSQNDLDIDLSNVYTAVRIVGPNSKSERIRLNQTGGFGVNARIQPNWDSGYQSNYAQGKHQWRRSDRGPDGEGVLIDEIQTVNGKTRLWFSANSSQHGDDHQMGATAGASEWTGAACIIITQDGNNVEAANVVGKVEAFYEDGWMDGPTNTIRRYAVWLDRDIKEQVPLLKDEVNDSAGDLFGLSTSELHAPNGPNKRWMVGRAYHIENTTEVDDAQYLTDQTCPASITQEIAGVQYYDQAQSAYKALEAPRTQSEINEFWGLNPENNPLGGQSRGWIIEPPENKPAQIVLNPCRPGPMPAPVPEVQFEFDKFTLDIFGTRVPEAGFAGTAFYYYRHAKELLVKVDTYEDDSQDAQFALVAENIWRRVSEPDYTGSITLNGITRWLPLSDLGFRVTLGSGYNGVGPVGVSTEQQRFNGLCQSITYDFREGSTQLSFSSRGFADDLIEGLFERKFVSETAEIRALRAEVERIKKEAACRNNNPSAKPPPLVPDCNVYSGPQSFVKKSTTIEIKEEGSGIGPTQLNTPTSAGGTTVVGSGGALAFIPSFVVERGYDGQAAAFGVPTGAMYAGTENGSTFLPVKSAPTFVPQPEWNGGSIQALNAALWGIDLTTPAQTIIVETTTGSTTTVIQLENVIPNDGRFDGGFLEFSDAGSEARPKYAISSHTGTAITLASAMSESAPGPGLRARVWAARPPLLNGTDFPNGGRAFKDTAGNWFVANDGDITSATLNSGVLDEETGSPNEAELAIGQSNTNITAAGDWDFTGATVTGVGGGFTSPATTAGDMIQYNGSTHVRIPIGTAGQVLTSNGVGAGWAAASGGSSPTTTQGDLIKRGASADERLAIGADGTVLKSDGTDPSWGSVDSGDLNAELTAMIYGQRVTLSGYVTASLSIGGTVRFLFDNSDNDLGYPLPSGKTFYVLSAHARMISGSTDGDYNVTAKIRRIEAANATTPSTDYTVASTTYATGNQWFEFTAEGTYSSPLATITGGSGYRLLLLLQNDGDSHAALPSDKHQLYITGVIV